MGYKTTGKPVGQDQMDAAVVFALATNRLNYKDRNMRHVTITSNPVTPGTTSCRFKVIVNAASDTVATVAGYFGLAATVGGWFYWDPKDGALDVSIDEAGGNTGVAQYCNRIRTIDFQPVNDSAGKGATAACAMEIKAIPCQ